MKKIIVITLLITFFSVFVLPKEGRATSAESTANGLLVGSIVLSIIVLIMVAAGKNKPLANKIDKQQGKISGEENLVSITWTNDLSFMQEKASREAMPISLVQW